MQPSPRERMARRSEIGVVEIAARAQARFMRDTSARAGCETFVNVETLEIISGRCQKN